MPLLQFYEYGATRLYGKGFTPASGQTPRGPDDSARAVLCLRQNTSHRTPTAPSAGGPPTPAQARLPSGRRRKRLLLLLGIVGTLLGRGADARWLIAAGLLIMAAGCYWMARMNLQISPWQVVWPRVVTIVGLSLIFAPLNVAAFLYMPKHLRGAAVGLLALLRNEGGSFGTSMSQTLQERREQFHLSRLGDSLDPLNPHVQNFLDQGQAFFMQHTGDPAGSQQMTVQALANLRQQQAASLAYFDVFWLCAALGVALVLLVLLMKRSVAERAPMSVRSDRRRRPLSAAHRRHRAFRR